MKKTLLISLDFWPNIGGVSNYYYNLARLFPKDKIVVLSNIKPSGGVGFKIIYKKLLYRFIWPKWLKSFFELIKTAKKEKIEIVWVGNILPLGFCAFLLKIFFRVPYFVSLHGLDIKLASSSSRKKVLTKIILQNAEFITVNSQTTLELVNRFTQLSGRIKKIVLLYPGISQDFFRIDEIKKENLINKYNLKNKKIILSVGRVVKRKNHELIIDAINLIRRHKDIEDLVYLIIGCGENLQYLQQKAKDLNLEKNILFLDNVVDEDLPYFYAISDIFAMISRTSKEDVEGFGIVYLEAGIFKKACIASRVGGGAEAVVDGKTGILIDENNQEEAMNAILYLLNDPIFRNELGENAYKRIVNSFLWEGIYKKLESNL